MAFDSFTVIRRFAYPWWFAISSILIKTCNCFLSFDNLITMENNTIKAIKCLQWSSWEYEFIRTSPISYHVWFLKYQ